MSEMAGFKMVAALPDEQGIPRMVAIGKMPDPPYVVSEYFPDAEGSWVVVQIMQAPERVMLMVEAAP